MLVSHTYHFAFDHPAEKLWSLVADTVRWGESAGFPKYQVREELQQDGSVRVTGEIQFLGFTVSWEELPADWIVERWFEQRRVNFRGPVPFESMTTRVVLADRGAQSDLEMTLSFDCSNVIGKWLARRMVKGYEKVIREMLDNADRLILAEQPELFVSTYQPAPAEIERGDKIAAEIAQTPYEHGLAPRLLELIRSSQEVDLWVMRPLAIARDWGAAAHQAVELFLQSVRSGLLESRWDILCPRCRVSKSQVANMSDLPRGVHCDSCNIDFDADFTRNVELNFSPSPSVRLVEPGFFCRSGPNVTPHIKSQWSIAADSSRVFPLALAAGSYRIRTLEAGGEVELNWDGTAFPEICVTGEQVTLGDQRSREEIRVVNRGAVMRTVVIESMDWMLDALTADQVTTLQAFRDLFSDQILRPGDEVSIRNIAFMFTDLVGSTKLYAELGDAGAYQVVREHFALLGSIVRTHRGNIVKTVGDGVHAAFQHPQDALLAAIEIQRALPDFNRRLGLEGISIRIGLHAGSSIAVTLNQRLDYYGEAVNLSARLEGQGEPGVITMSRGFSEDPAVDKLLRDYPVRESETRLKGIDDAVPIKQFMPLAQT